MLKDKLKDSSNHGLPPSIHGKPAPPSRMNVFERSYMMLTVGLMMGSLVTLAVVVITYRVSQAAEQCAPAQVQP
ncbi:MAG: hypothetical protein WA883_20775 [Phormidesmis sp.]